MNVAGVYGPTRDSVIAPVDALALICEAVPAIDVTPAFVKVTDPPSDTEPPPLMPVPGLIVNELLVSALFGMFVSVFALPEMLLFANVCAAFNSPNVSDVTAGIVCC